MSNVVEQGNKIIIQLRDKKLSNYANTITWLISNYEKMQNNVLVYQETIEEVQEAIELGLTRDKLIDFIYVKLKSIENNLEDIQE